MRKFEVFIPGRATSVLIMAKEIKNLNDKVYFYNETGYLCGIAPADAIVSEIFN